MYVYIYIVYVCSFCTVWLNVYIYIYYIYITYSRLIPYCLFPIPYPLFPPFALKPYTSLYIFGLGVRDWDCWDL